RKGELRTLRNELAQLVEETSQQPSVSDLHPVTGAPRTPAGEQAQIAFRSLLQFFAARREALSSADTLTAPPVAQLLGVSRQPPLNRVREGTILGILDRGAWRFPNWQFDPKGPDGVLPGLPAVLKTLEPQQAFAKMIFLQRPSPTFDNQTPIELLRN